MNLVSGVAENEAEDLGLVLHTTIDGVSLRATLLLLTLVHLITWLQMRVFSRTSTHHLQSNA